MRRRAAAGRDKKAAAVMDSDELLRHHAEFKDQGWTVVPGFLTPMVVSQLRDVLDPVFAHPEDIMPAGDSQRLERQKIGGHFRREKEIPGSDLVPTTGSLPSGTGAGILDCAATHPELARLCTCEILLQQVLLDFAELAMGTVQLDSMQMSALAPAPQQHAGDVGTAGWHRDGANTASAGAWWRWDKSDGPRQAYVAPLGINALIYLQEMTFETGPLRVVPFSHMSGQPTPTPEEKMRPMPGEAFLDAKAGDLVLIHADLLHATCVNTGKLQRYFISTFLVPLGFPHRDEFDCTAVSQLLQSERAKPGGGDRRVLRLFGQDAEAVHAEEEGRRLASILQCRHKL